MQRPTTITVFGILNITFGALGVLGTVFAVLTWTVLPASMFAPEDSTQRIMHNVQISPLYEAWTILTTVLGGLAAAVLIAAGIGLLMIKPWARLVGIGYALFTIFLTVIGLPINYFFMVQPMMRALREEHSAEQQIAGMIGGAVGIMCGGVIMLGYPIILWIFMTRPKVVEAMSM